MRGRAAAVAAGGLALLLPLALLRTVAPAPARLIPAPFEGVDPLLQAGLLDWSVRHWWQPAVWSSPPIFYPAAGAIAGMDGLLGQALLVWPAHALLGAPPALLYNLAVLGSLLLAAAAFALLWRSGGGGWAGAAFGAAALVGSPYTLSQCGHLNQLPPAAAVATVAALLAAWRRTAAADTVPAPGATAAPAATAAPLATAAGTPPASRPAAGRAAGWWWLAGAAAAAQAAWGWYGFGFAVAAGTVISVHGAWACARGGRLGAALRALWLPALLTAAAVAALAAPWLRTAAREPAFRRTASEVRAFSADWRDLAAPTTYRGLGAREGTAPWRRRTLHPGWVALGAAAWGWSQRRRLESARRRDGLLLLGAGLLGLALAFGDSAGLPGSERRLPLPWAWLQALCPLCQAFRAVWRFSFLFTLAVAWWAAAGFEARPPGRRLAGARAGGEAAVREGARLWPWLLVVALALESWPARLPVADLAAAAPTRARAAASEAAAGAAPPGAVLTLPAPMDEAEEDPTEALWLLRAQAVGRPVTGGVSGWVPPVTRELRRRLRACETGAGNVDSLLAAWRALGVASAALAPGAGDSPPWRVAGAAYWDRALRERGWRPGAAAAGYVLFLPPEP